MPYTATDVRETTGQTDFQFHLGPCELTLVGQTFAVSQDTVIFHDSTTNDNPIFTWVGPSSGTAVEAGFSIYFQVGLFVEFTAGNAATETTVGIR